MTDVIEFTLEDGLTDIINRLHSALKALHNKNYYDAKDYINLACGAAQIMRSQITENKE